MVSIHTVGQSNALIATLLPGLVALFIGATSSIGQSTLQHFAQHVPSPRIYSVARPPVVASHKNLLASLRQSDPTGTYTFITGDVFRFRDRQGRQRHHAKRDQSTSSSCPLASWLSKAARIHARALTPPLTTRYDSRLCAVRQLLPLLNNSAAPNSRIISVLDGGMERPLNEQDLDLREPRNWPFWNASVRAGTMSMLVLELLA